MSTLIGLLLWCLLWVLCWPLALLVLVLWPLAWLVSLPFRAVAFGFGVALDLAGAILSWPARMIRGR